MVRAFRMTSYVVAPVVIDGSVAGLLHADRFGMSVGPVDVELALTFAEGLGQALERLDIARRLEVQTARFSAAVRLAADAVGEVERRGLMALDPLARLEWPTAGDGQPPAATERLTRREI